MKIFALCLCMPGVFVWNAPAQSFYHDVLRLATFGGALAVTDTHLLIGEPTGFRHPGTVHVYAEQAGAWQRVQQLRASDAQVGDAFGRLLSVDGTSLLVAAEDAVYFFEFDGSHWSQVMQASHGAASLSLHGAMALVGVPGQNEGAGMVHVYQKGGDGWAPAATLAGEARQFGRAAALHDGVALIGAASSVTFFRWNGADFEQEAHFSGLDLNISSSFGAAVHLSGSQALAGSPRDRERQGSAQVFRYDGAWRFDRHLLPRDVQSGDGFGAVLASNADGFWVGAPLSKERMGRVYTFPHEGGASTMVRPNRDHGTNQRFGTALALGNRRALVGMPGSAYGEGGALLLVKDGPVWKHDTVFVPAVDALEPVLGDEARCDTGGAAGFECSRVDLVSFLPREAMGLQRGVRLNDVWGWTDPATGREYGLVGHLEGTAFVDLSDASRPVFLGELPRTAGSPGSTWRDIKVYKDHAFIVADGAGAHGMQVFDLSRLRLVGNAPTPFDADAHYDAIHSAHNIVINEETGYAYAVGVSGGGKTCGGGLHIIDIRQPQAPVFAGCFADETTGRRKTGYSHDAQCVVYHGPDAAYRGKEICIGANETAISIADITDKQNPVAIATGSYPDAMYVHQGWLTEDHAFFYQNDELDEISRKIDRTRTLIWDVSDLDDPVLVNQYYGPSGATDHNLYVHENLMYQTNNASGLRILDITDRAMPQEVGFFDTTPYGTNEAGFNGTWSSYPYFKSGIIVVTSRREGLFILKKQAVGS